MSVNIKRAIDFIGHASSYPELDDFLIGSGVEQRLTAEDLPSAELLADNGTVVLQFTSSYAEIYGKPRSDGLLFLEDVTAQNPKYEDDIGPFTSDLPLGLRMDMTGSDIVSLLGEPGYSGEFFGGHFLTYDGLIPNITVNIKLDIKSREIIFVRFMPVEV
ncbi:hypothetical protein [Alloalcanivorax xenomutans]|uniref:hypothetical protein n=1 Tax=Alloalcanivorax xenomutans TaxID=1094342 RepID=UPI0009B6B234|nr:hypothetical protein [Alloalcanivorax xenomutans]ARB46101.1 hypothetical protein P40_12385 [Alloalcanivorax xenomutans]WOA29722.1 hypothetical protein RVY87_12610 [Alloalcanivorax xenomutans]WOD26680.1 hypothetical protein RYH70_11695 [Alloalcanivorax xenomutans]